jgi:hypothetical protein
MPPTFRSCPNEADTKPSHMAWHPPAMLFVRMRSKDWYLISIDRYNDLNVADSRQENTNLQFISRPRSSQLRTHLTSWRIIQPHRLLASNWA